MLPGKAHIKGPPPSPVTSAENRATLPAIVLSLTAQGNFMTINAPHDDNNNHIVCMAQAFKLEQAFGTRCIIDYNNSPNIIISIAVDIAGEHHYYYANNNSHCFVLLLLLLLLFPIVSVVIVVVIVVVAAAAAAVADFISLLLLL